MVVHLKDRPNSHPLDLLTALMENEQNDTLANAHYPTATSAKTTAGACHTDHSRAQRHMDKQDRYADRKAGGYTTGQMQLGRDEHPGDRSDVGEHGYVICPVQLDAEPMDIQSDTEDPMLDPNVNAWMDQGFHCGMTQAVDGADGHFGRCFNCLEEGHRWRECKNTPLLTELQEILDREVLNRKGGTGSKGGHAPMNPRNGKGKVTTPTKPAQ